MNREMTAPPIDPLTNKDGSNKKTGLNIKFSLSDRTFELLTKAQDASLGGNIIIRYAALKELLSMWLIIIEDKLGEEISKKLINKVQMGMLIIAKYNQEKYKMKQGLNQTKYIFYKNKLDQYNESIQQMILSALNQIGYYKI